MGRTTLEYLKNVLHVDLRREVKCFSSSDKVIRLSDGESLQSESLDSLKSVDHEIEGIFHFAFLTRDYLSKMGFEKYVKTNGTILEVMSQALSHVKYRWIVAVSSGAVYEPSTRRLSEDIKTNPYGFLKISEENLLKKLSSASDSNCVIGRLWASSGSLMPLDRKYALSDFIYQGVTSNQISVNSSREVWRRYIDAQDFISVLHTMAREGLDQTIDSSGELIEIGDLASRIGLLTMAKVARPNFSPLSTADLYYPEGFEMQHFAKEYSFNIKTIDEQIVATLRGHIQQIESRKGAMG
jgi:nucleoside-diphosphate-sugar epimerase